MPPARTHAQFEHGGNMPSDQGGHGGEPADHRAREEPSERPRRWRSEKALNRAARRAPGKPILERQGRCADQHQRRDRKSTRLNSSHPSISYAVFCLKKKKAKNDI